MVNERSITSVEYMSLKELVAMLLGIKIIDGIEIMIPLIILVVIITLITSLMIYLVNAYQLQNNSMIIEN